MSYGYCSNCGSSEEDCECESTYLETEDEYFSDDIGETSYDGDCA